MKESDTTLETYESHIHEYIEGTPQEVSGHVKEWIDRVLSLVPIQGNILEIGSAFGRDAKYIESLGYEVLRTDATQAFVDLLNDQGYDDAKVLNAITEDFGTGWSLIFANAVFLHFTPEELTIVLQKTYNGLNGEGILAFSVKQGDDSEWSEEKMGAPRFFNYWTSEPLRNLLTSTGFDVLEINDGNEGHSQSSAQWINIIAKKPGE